MIILALVLLAQQGSDVDVSAAFSPFPVEVWTVAQVGPEDAPRPVNVKYRGQFVNLTITSFTAVDNYGRKTDKRPRNVYKVVKIRDHRKTVGLNYHTLRKPDQLRVDRYIKRHPDRFFEIYEPAAGEGGE